MPGPAFSLLESIFATETLGSSTVLVSFCTSEPRAYFSITEPSVGGVNDSFAVKFDGLVLVVAKDELDERGVVVVLVLVVVVLFPSDDEEETLDDIFVDDDVTVPAIAGVAFCATVVIFGVVCVATPEVAFEAPLSCFCAALGNGVAVALAAVVSFCPVSSCFLSMI